MGIYAHHDGEWYRVDEGGSGDCELLGGVAGWASIDSVSGTADLTTLKNDGIAPESATEDPDVPGTYNIVGDDGVVYRVAVWTDTTQEHSLTTSGGLVDALIVGSMRGEVTVDSGNVVAGINSVAKGTLPVKVGQKGPNGTQDNMNSYLGEYTQTNPFIAQNNDNTTSSRGIRGLRSGDNSLGFKTFITGTETIHGDTNNPAPPGYGNTKGNLQGVVVVRAPKDAANNPKPDAPVAWGQFNSVPTGFTDEGAYVDGQGRAWKWYEFADEGDFEIDLTGGQYWVLAVGGGDGGYSTANQQSQNGQPGNVREGYWEFAKNDSTPIKVGKRGSNNTYPNGGPSFVGDILNGFSVQSETNWGQTSDGRGIGSLGYQSSITGKMLEYATGYNKEKRPGRSGSNNNEQEDGCVIIATVTNEPNLWNPPGALPGLGGWATITDVKGKGNKYSYTDADGDWIAYEWTADGELTTADGGLVDVFLISGGGGGTTTYYQGTGGRASYGLQNLTTITVDIKVGAGGQNDVNNGISNPSQIATFSTGVNGFGKGGPGLDQAFWREIESSITGESRTYGRFGDKDGNHPETVRPNRGDGGYRGSWAPSDGVVIIRIPKANDGRSDIAGSAAGEPFDIPTTREAIVQALEEKVEEARESVRDRRNGRRKRR